MTNRNDDSGSKPNERPDDWSEKDDTRASADDYNSARGDSPKPVPPHEPEDWQAPGPQGPRVSQGGEWDAGHTIEEDSAEQHTRARTWQEGMHEQGSGRIMDEDIDQPPAKRGRTRPKLDSSEVFAVIMAAIFPGVGQMMLGQQTKGIVVLLVAIATGCGLGLLSIASAVDAYCIAMAEKKREVDEWEFFPDIGEVFGDAQRTLKGS